MKTFLHVGCGPVRYDPETGAMVRPKGFAAENWQELRLDINPQVQPDVVGSMTDMSAVANGSVDAIYSSHNIEHLYPHEVSLALSEFKRVLKPDGFCVIACPDLQSVCELVIADKLTETAYESPAGPITPLDILYGHRPALKAGNLFMAHRCGFTLNVLLASLEGAAFAKVIGYRNPQAFELWSLGTMMPLDDNSLRALATEFFMF